MWSIQQNGDGWDVLLNGTVLSSHGTYDAALAVIAARLAVGQDEPENDATATGVLTERWTSTTGIAFREQPDPERDFTQCQWSFRDPAVYPLPLMLQTSTEVGHFGAVLAGFMDTVVEGDTPSGSGGFYDSDAGRQFRDMLLSGNRFGVSVDPGDLDVEFVCTETDDDGWCDAGKYVFLAYQIIGLTGTPFPAFANATIELDTGAAAPADDADDDEPAEDEAGAIAASAWSRPVEPVTAAGSTFTPAPMRPPLAWYDEPEPEIGDERLVEQEDGSLACPLTITDDGQVYGHLARWGQCHVSNPQGPNVCVTPPESETGYAGFHLGVTVCDDGTQLATGALFTGCDHPGLRLSATEARDAYANNGTAWADVRVSSGEFGPWVAGALRPNVSELQVRILRASALSGDWRELAEHPGRLDLIAGLAVNVPGFPIRRALAASAGAVAPSLVRTAARVVNGEAVALVASGIVTPCPECARRQRAEATAAAVVSGDTTALAAILAKLDVLDRRTRHLAPDAAAALAARIRG